MPRTRIYLGTCPNGDVVKRTTRTKFYTLGIVARPNFDHEMQYAYNSERTKLYEQRFSYLWKFHHSELGDCTTAADFANMEIRRVLDRIEQRRLEGVFDHFTLLTCMETDKYMRRYLKQYGRNPWYCEVQPIPLLLHEGHPKT